MTIRGVQGGSGTGSTTIINNITNITSQGNGLISGGGVAWTGLLNFTVSAASYSIQGTTYSSAQTNLTLAAADVSLDRIDVIAVNTSGAAVAITGTPAATPLAPSIDPTTQLQLTFVYVAAGATVPSNITTTNDIYHENTEWTSAAVGGTINTASTNNPHLGTKDCEGTAVVAGNILRFTNGSTIDLADSNNLVFWISSKAAWASTRSLQLQWFNTNAARGQPVILREGSFQFVSGTTTYQQIVIPLSQFQANGLAVNRLQVTAFGTGGTMGFYLDDFVLQNGLDQVTTTFMNWRGVYSATHQYAFNDVVSYLGAVFICINAVSASTPSLSNTNWQIITGAAAVQTVAYAAAISVNLDNYPYSPVKLTTTLTGNATVTFTGGFVGQVVMWEFIQGGAGSFLWTPNAVIKFSTALPTFVLSTAVGAADHISFYVKTAGSAYRVLANNLGF